MMGHDPRTRTNVGPMGGRPGEDAQEARAPRPSAPRDKDDPSKAPHTPPVVMPGPEAVVGAEIAQIGVEGKPTFSKAGPGALLLTLGGVGLLIVIAAVTVGLLVNWGTGLAVLGVGALGLLFNPLIAATLLRARDRQDVADSHLPAERRGR